MLTRSQRYGLAKLLVLLLALSGLSSIFATASQAATKVTPYTPPHISISRTENQYLFLFPKISTTSKYLLNFIDDKKKIAKSLTVTVPGYKTVVLPKNAHWPSVNISFFDRKGILRVTKNFLLPLYKPATKNSPGAASPTPQATPTTATLPSPTPTPTPSPTPASTSPAPIAPTPSPSVTPSPTPTPTPSPSATPTPTPTPTPTVTQPPAPVAPPYVPPPVVNPPTYGSETITGSIFIGQQLTAQLSNVVGATGTTYAWLASANLSGPYTAVANATSPTLTTDSTLTGHYIEVQITLSNSGGNRVATSTPYGPLILESPVISLASSNVFVNAVDLSHSSFPYTPWIDTITASGGPIDSYFLGNGDPALFAVDTQTGAVQILRYLDPVVSTSYQIGIGARNGAGLIIVPLTIQIDTPTLTLGVVGSPNPFTGAFTQSMSWDVASQVDVGQVILTTTIPGLDAFTYNCGMTNTSDFIISGNQMVLATVLGVGTHTGTIVCEMTSRQFILSQPFTIEITGPTAPPHAAAITIQQVAGHAAPLVGDMLSFSGGRLIDGGPVTFALQWFRDSAVITGAFLSQYTVQSDDIGHILQLRLTYSNGITPDFVETATTGVAVVALIPTISSVSITSASLSSSVNAPGAGAALTANVTFNPGGAAATLAYQWYYDNNGVYTAIANANSSTYTPTSPTDINKKIVVGVQASNTYGSTSEIKSPSTNPVYGFSYDFNPSSPGSLYMQTAYTPVCAITTHFPQGVTPVFSVDPSTPLPLGLSIDPATGLILGATPGAWIGLTNYIITMTDASDSRITSIATISFAVDLIPNIFSA